MLFEVQIFPHWLRVGSEVILHENFLHPIDPFQYKNKMSDQVLAFRFFPGLNPHYLDCVIGSPAKTIILHALGYGNVAVQKKSLVEFIQKITDIGKLVVVTSQSLQAKVDLLQYENGYLIKEAGAIGAGDMTNEATIVKLMHLLGYYSDNLDKVRELLTQSIAGEISESLGSLSTLRIKS